MHTLRLPKARRIDIRFVAERTNASFCRLYYDAENDMIYEPTTTEQEQFLDEYLKEKGLNKEKLTKIGWYKRWGGKAVFILVLAFVLGIPFIKNEDEIKEPIKL